MLGAVTWTCTRPIEIVIRPKFLFDFRVSDAYVSAQLFDGCLYYFFMLVVVVRYETAATARRALLFIVRAFFNDTIAVAVWTGFHMRLMAMLPQSHDYIRWCFADPAIAARPHDVRFTPKSGHSSAWCEPGHAGLICRGLKSGGGELCHAPQAPIQSLLRSRRPCFSVRRVRHHGVAYFGGNCS